MNNILLTGVSGNVGSAALEYLSKTGTPLTVGVRHIDKFNKQSKLIKVVKLDFQKTETFPSALKGIKKVFLVRPPQLTDFKSVFEPFIKACVDEKVEQIVFLSLLGIEKNPFPPHYKIEKAIKASGIAYTFIRPSFFMQNLSTTHVRDIIENDDIFIPSGNAKINFIDTKDIGEMIGRVLIEDGHNYKKYTITGPNVLTYYEVANIMSEELAREIIYSKPSMMNFRQKMIKQGINKEFVSVMMVLYLTTRLGMANVYTDTAEQILGRKPKDIRSFIQSNKEKFNQNT